MISSNESLPVAFEGGGLHEEDRVIRGEYIKFIDGAYSVKSDPTFRPDVPFLSTGTGTVLQSFHGGQGPKFRRKEADRSLRELCDKLNSEIPQAQWEPDREGKPRPPWQQVWFIYLVRLSDGALFTHMNGTLGCRIGVRELADRVEVTTALRGPVIPVVTLGSKPFKTKMGIKQRPHFAIVEWRPFGPPSAPTPVPAPKTPQIGSSVDPAKVGKPVKEPTLAEEMNDALPF